MNRAAAEAYRSRVRGCLLGGAIGDALGGPVEFRSLAEIHAAHPDGVRTFVGDGPGWPPGTVTDDTQMTMFTVEGLIRAGVRRDRGIGFTLGVVHHAYDRWLDTQQLHAPSGERDGWLITVPWLYARRAPGMTCLGALNNRGGGFGTPAVNDSKGCGGVMRVAPVGLLPPGFGSTDDVYDAAAEIAGYTHGHPTGKAASGALAVIVRAIVEGADLDTALDTALDVLAGHRGTEETVRALRQARQAAATDPGRAETIEDLGGGWIAEEALAIAVYAALSCTLPRKSPPHPDNQPGAAREVAPAAEATPARTLHRWSPPHPDNQPGAAREVAPAAEATRHQTQLDALSLAVTHSGDSDSTGAICGNILGALHGETALPPSLVHAVEGRGTLLELADDLVLEFTETAHLHDERSGETGWVRRYPGW